MDRYQNKYRIASARLRNWDYGSNAMYFVTICTAYRQHYFGDVADRIMKLSEIGKIAETEWCKTFELRPDMNLHMGEFQVMPNHFHAIIGIGKNKYNTKIYDNDGGCGDDGCGDGGDEYRDAMHRVSTDTDIYKNKFAPQSKNLASIIRGFKSAVTPDARIIHADFAWQSRFHDHIIRDRESFIRISNYIKNNPSKWSDDKFYGKKR